MLLQAYLHSSPTKATAVKTRPTSALKIATGGKGKKKGKSKSIMYIPKNSLSCLATDADYAKWEAEETANHRMEELEHHFEAERSTLLCPTHSAQNGRNLVGMACQ